MQGQHLKSKIISEDCNYQIERLVQQLDQVKHVAESDFWLSTDELGLLLNLDDSFIESLNVEVESQNSDYRFFWRNFECFLIDRQFKQGFWLVRKRQDVLFNNDNNSSQKFADLPTRQDPQTSTSNESIILNLAPEAEIIPTPYALIDDFLSASQLHDLLRYSISQQVKFIPTTNSASDPNYRRSFFLSHFPDFSELMINLVRKITPQIITHLGINNFAIGQIESQMTAHNHGNYYKIHNGMPNFIHGGYSKKSKTTWGPG
jgi:Rps23 Pro-64 3,4-dihydroxylase Tpa1-like proline 4-hydroxylase